MFKNRAIQVKLVTPDTGAVAGTADINVAQIAQLIEASIKPAALGIAYVYGVKTASQIVLHIARTYIK